MLGAILITFVPGFTESSQQTFEVVSLRFMDETPEAQTVIYPKPTVCSEWPHYMEELIHHLAEGRSEEQLHGSETNR